MAERRQASRREPIEVEVRGTVFTAVPLPWQIAGDLGDEIVRQNADAVNNSVRLFVEGDLPQLDLALAKKISDWNRVLLIAYPENKAEDFVGFDTDEVAELVMASLDVNHLEHLRNLVDPNSLAPTTPGGPGTSEGTTTDLGQPTTFTPSSDSSASPEPTPLISLAENSSSS